jgi:hypothetical protein
VHIVAVDVPVREVADDGRMPVRVVLVDADGRPQSVDDPAAGGRFDAAGDFDRLIGIDAQQLPMWSSLYAQEDWTFEEDDLAGLLEDLDVLETRAVAGPEQHGLARLRRLAEAALTNPALTLEWRGE